MNPERLPKSRATLKDRLFLCAALALGTAMAVLVGEVALRLVLPGFLSSGSRERELFCRFDPKIGWVPRENITAIHTGAGWPALVHQNRFGMRGGDDVELAKPPGKRRVLVLGDSYGWGFGVDQDKLFSSPQVHGTQVEILNLAVSGYGTDQEYLLYLQRGTNFTVDEVVVALTPYNDIGNNLEAEQYGYLKPYFELQGGKLGLHTDHIRERRIRRVGGWLRRESRVWNLIGVAIRRLGEKTSTDRTVKGAAKAKKTLLTPEDVTEQDRTGVELTVAILERFREAVAAQKAEFTVVFVPYKPHIDQLQATNHPLVPLLAAGLAKTGIKYREPYDEFLKAARSGARLFNDPDNHFEPEGHALFAKFLTGTEMAKASENYYARPQP